MSNEKSIGEKLFILFVFITSCFFVYCYSKQPQSENGSINITNKIQVGGGTLETKNGERNSLNTGTTIRENKIRVNGQTTGTISRSDSLGEKSLQMMSNDTIDESLLNAGVHKDMVSIVRKVGKEYKIHPYYIAMVGLAENIRNPRAVGDNGCSYGAYQFNKCPGNRDEQIRFGKKFEDCAKDYECSTRMVAEKIRSAYKCVVDENGYIEKFYECLPLHNGTNYKQWYVDKLIKANKTLFSIGG